MGQPNLEALSFTLSDLDDFEEKINETVSEEITFPEVLNYEDLDLCQIVQEVERGHILG